MPFGGLLGIELVGEPTPEQVRARLEELAAMGATHLLLNPTARYAEHVDALASMTGLA
jgi:alkanesulfonate monooxygenase SsuD/methylene tetrahydromethanopterin reductase-like flavin-dependent oxidoreductase (luciferase family)